MEPTESTFNPPSPDNPTRRVVIGKRVVSARLAAFLQKRGLLKAGKPKATKTTKLAAAPSIAEPAPVFTTQALAYFRMATNALERADMREGKRLLLAAHYLKNSGDPFISTINPIELLKEIKCQTTTPKS